MNFDRLVRKDNAVKGLTWKTKSRENSTAGVESE